MAFVELKAAGVVLGPAKRFGSIDLVLEPGRTLAIVGRAGSGKTLLAEALAGRRRFRGEAFLSAKPALLDASADAASLTQALETGANLIVADEPGAAHPPANQRELLAALQLAQRDRGIAYVILTGDFRLPLSMGIDTAILAQGVLVERGAPDDLMIHPKHEATREHTHAARPRTRTMARPPIGGTLLEFVGVTRHLGDPDDRPWAKRTPTVALQRIELQIRRGEAVGLLGPGGSGKSLLLLLAAGLGRTTAGGFQFESHRYRGSDMPRDVRARIAVLLPDPHAAFNPALPVGLTLTEPLRVEEQLLIDEQAKGLVEAVRVVGLSPNVLEQRPATFTPFDLQRLALARALVGRPSLIMLDEPTAKLDAVGTAQFIQLFNRVRSDYGLTVFWTSRSFDTLRRIADRIAVLEGGNIVEVGRPGELFESGTHPTTRVLLVARYPEPPPPMPPAAEPVAEPRSEEPAPQPEPVPDPVAAEEVQSEPEVTVVEPAPLVVEPDPDAIELVTEAPAPDAEPVVIESEPLPEPEPIPEPALAAEPEPDPVAPVTSAGDDADEAAEGGQVELVVDRSSHRSRRVDPADDEGESDDSRALRHVEGA